MCTSALKLVGRGFIDATLLILVALLFQSGETELPFETRAEAGLCEGCPTVACAPSCGWCIGVTGVVGTCQGWGVYCSGGHKKCLGTLSPLTPAPGVPGAACNCARGC